MFPGLSSLTGLVGGTVPGVASGGALTPAVSGANGAPVNTGALTISGATIGTSGGAANYAPYVAIGAVVLVAFMAFRSKH